VSCVDRLLQEVKTSGDVARYQEAAEFFYGLILLSDLRVATSILKTYSGERLTRNWTGGYDARGHSYWLICREAFRWSKSTQLDPRAIHELFSWLNGGIKIIADYCRDNHTQSTPFVVINFFQSHPSIITLIDLVETELDLPIVLQEVY
jgi:hypothetical protein